MKKQKILSFVKKRKLELNLKKKIMAISSIFVLKNKNNKFDVYDFEDE
jgi:hypothetical protein